MNERAIHSEGNAPATARRPSLAGYLTLLVVGLLVGAILVTLAGRTETTVIDHIGSQVVSDAMRSYADLERREPLRLEAVLDSLMARDDLQDQFARRDRMGLYDAVSADFERLSKRFGVTRMYFSLPEPESTIFLRVHDPEKFGDSVRRSTHAAAVRTKYFAAGKEFGVDEFALRVVHPFYGAEGDLLGYIEVGQGVEHLLDSMKVSLGDEYGLALDRDVLAGEMPFGGANGPATEPEDDRHPDLVLTYATSPAVDLADTPPLSQSMRDGPVAFTPVRSEGRSFTVGSFPLLDADQRFIGVVLVRHEVTALAREIGTIRGLAMAELAGLSVVSLVLLALAAGRRRMSSV